MLKIKEGVDLAGIRPEMVVVMVVAREAFALEGKGFDAVVTSARDGKHSRGSLHYTGLALDFRTSHLPGASGPRESSLVAKRISEVMREALGKQYDVVWEKDHIHVEFQPKEET